MGNNKETENEFTKRLIEHVSFNSDRKVVFAVMTALVDEINSKVSLLKKLLGELPFTATVPDTARIKLSYDHILGSKVTVGEIRREISVMRMIPAIPQKEWCMMGIIHDLEEIKKKKAI
jgi:methyl coenzyme M reductase subunit C-like uncharacterized protein (methanogenesis marker protein 7)